MVLLLLLLVAAFGVAVAGTGVAVAALVVGTGVAVAGAVAVAVAVAGAVVGVAPEVSPASKPASAAVEGVAIAMVELKLSLFAVVPGAVAVSVGETPVEVTTGAGFAFTGLAISSPQAPSEAARATVTRPLPQNELLLEPFFREFLGFSPISLNFDISFPFFYRAQRITIATGDYAEWNQNLYPVVLFISGANSYWFLNLLFPVQASPANS